jgi:hypothetical protein
MRLSKACLDSYLSKAHYRIELRETRNGDEANQDRACPALEKAEPAPQRKAEAPKTDATGCEFHEPGYAHYAGGLPGGIDNPLGARALYLYRGNQDTLFRLHGTNEPDTIGEKVSSGCIRLFNHDIIDLYDRVPVGAPVVVLQEAGQPFRADAEADDLYWPAVPVPPWPGFEPDWGQ